MSTIENPPAFPNTGAYGHTGNYLPEGGMTLRDWFAGQAIHAAIHFAWDMPVKEASPMPQAARLAYELADAMLAERTKGVSV